jgi:hypothetical protein
MLTLTEKARAKRVELSSSTSPWDYFYSNYTGRQSRGQFGQKYQSRKRQMSSIPHNLPKIHPFQTSGKGWLI